MNDTAKRKENTKNDMHIDNSHKSNLLIVNLISLLSAGILVFLDQLTKYYVLTELTEGKVNIIDGVLSFTFVKNTGAVWGLFKDKAFILSIISIVVLAMFVAVYFILDWNNRRLRILKIISVFVCAGAIGNLIDRIRLNYVVDFIYFELINFPVFNVADCYVTVSMILMIILFLFYYREEDFSNLFKKKSNSGKA